MRYEFLNDKKAEMILGLVTLLLGSTITMTVSARPAQRISKPVIVFVAGAGRSQSFCIIEVFTVSYKEEWKGGGTFDIYIPPYLAGGTISITGGNVSASEVRLFGQITGGPLMGRSIEIYGAVGAPTTVGVSISDVGEILIQGVILAVGG